MKPDLPVGKQGAKNIENCELSSEKSEKSAKFWHSAWHTWTIHAAMLLDRHRIQYLREGHRKLAVAES